MSSALVIRGAADVAIDMAVGWTERRDATVAVASGILAIESANDQRIVVNVIRDLRAIQKAVEDSRTEVKRPVLDLGKRIDSFAKEFTGPIDAEVVRLNAIVGAYQAKVEAERIAEERRRAAELRAAQEAEAKARAAAEAERIRAEREAAEKAKAAQQDDDPFGAAEAEAQLKAALEKQASADAEAKRRTVEVSASFPVIPQRIDGMHVRRTPEFEITDLLQFANARPDLVTITPKRAEILAHIRQNHPEFDGRKVIGSGITAWWSGKVVVR